MADVSIQHAVPTLMNCNGNVANNWKVWFQRFIIYLLVNKKEFPKPQVKMATLLNFIGEERIRIVFTRFHLLIIMNKKTMMKSLKNLTSILNLEKMSYTKVSNSINVHKKLTNCLIAFFYVNSLM